MALELNWGDWVYGVGAGFIGGGAGAVTSGVAAMMIDSHDFSIYTGKFYGLIGLTFIGNGMNSMFMYLAQHPLPDKIVTTVKTEVTKDTPPMKTVTTVEETKTETKKPDGG